MKTYSVEIKRHEDDSVERKIPCKSEKHAVQVANGVDINLNHELYYSEVIEEEAEQ